jgi:DNA-binding MarR family transcriptional regulator
LNRQISEYQQNGLFALQDGLYEKENTERNDMPVEGSNPVQFADLISGANRKLEQAFAARLKPYGLSIEQYRVLKTLSAHNGIPMGDLAARVFVDSPTLTKIIDKMVSSADVYRGPDPLDRRRVLIFLSAKGVKTYAALEGIGQDIQDNLFGQMGDESSSQLATTLLQLLQ